MEERIFFPWVTTAYAAGPHLDPQEVVQPKPALDLQPLSDEELLLNLIVSVIIICKRISKELPHATPFERTFFFFIFLLLIINFKFPVTACEANFRAALW